MRKPNQRLLQSVLQQSFYERQPSFLQHGSIEGRFYEQDTGIGKAGKGK